MKPRLRPARFIESTPFGIHIQFIIPQHLQNSLHVCSMLWLGRVEDQDVAQVAQGERVLHIGCSCEGGVNALGVGAHVDPREECGVAEVYGGLDWGWVED